MALCFCYVKEEGLDCFTKNTVLVKAKITKYGFLALIIIKMLRQFLTIVEIILLQTWILIAFVQN